MPSRMDLELVERVAGQVLVVVRGVVDPGAVFRLATRLDDLLNTSTGTPVEVVIDLSAVLRCDCRLLSVLAHDHRWGHVVRGRVTVRGLHAPVLTGFAQASLPQMLAAYHVSRALGGPVWPREPGWTGAPRRLGEPERRVARFCADLITTIDTTTDTTDTRTGTGTAAVATLLVQECVGLFGVQAAVLLATPSPTAAPAAPRWVVVSATGDTARVLAAAGIATGEGPVERCLRLGEPVSAPDLAGVAARWPRYVDDAQRRGVAAVRALPLRGGARPSGAAAVIGALVVFSEQPGPMAPADLQVFEAFADLAGAAVAIRTGPEPAAPPGRVGLWLGAAADRVVIDQATGVVAEREQLSVAHALAWLIEQARHRDLHLTEIARAVLNDHGDNHSDKHDNHDDGDRSPLLRSLRPDITDR